MQEELNTLKAMMAEKNKAIEENKPVASASMKDVLGNTTPPKESESILQGFSKLGQIYQNPNTRRDFIDRIERIGEGKK